MRIEGCFKCKLHKSRSKIVNGKGAKDAKYMFVGEAPGQVEDIKGEPFVGKAGLLLRDMINEVGISKNDIYLTNICKCRPPGNRAPEEDEIACCSNYLLEEIVRVDPLMIICLGTTAFHAITGSVEPVSKNRGIVKQLENDKLCLVTFHPAYVLRNPLVRNMVVGDLTKAVEFTERGIGYIEPKYVLVDSIEKFKFVYDRTGLADRIAFDTETTGTDIVKDKIVGVSLSWEVGTGFYIPLRVRNALTLDLEDYWGDWQQVVISNLRKILEGEVPKCAHNGKFDVVFLKRDLDILVKEYIFDTMIAARLTNDAWDIGLDELTEIYAPELMMYRSNLYEFLKPGEVKRWGYSNVQLELLCDKSCSDVDMALRLAEMFKDKVNQRMMYEYLMPLQEVLGEMEDIGIEVDMDYLHKLDNLYKLKLSLKVNELDNLAPGVNVGSTKQLGELFFNKLGLRSIRKTKSGKHEALDDKVLLELAKENPLPQLVIDYRKLTKLKSTYVDGVLERVGNDNKIHTTYYCTTAITGRLSSRNPNLQNVINDLLIKKMYIAGQGYKFLAGDYSQMELRILAWYAKDENMLDCFRRGEDIHTMTACLIFKCTPEEVKIDPQKRRIAKALNFGIIYGGTIYGLAESLGMSIKEMTVIYQDYFKKFFRVKEWEKEIISRARTDGKVVSIFGRERLLPDIRSTDDFKRERAERQAVNSLIQGTAADFCNYSSVRVQNSFKRAGLKSRLVLTIHDELWSKVPEQELDIAKQLKSIAMIEPVFEINIPMKVDLDVVNSWGDKSK